MTETVYNDLINSKGCYVKMNVVKKFVDILLYLVLVFCMLLAAFYIVPQLMDYEVLAQSSSQMKPEIEPGSLIYVKKCDPAGVDIGDIALFENGNNYTVSRIVYIDYENNIIETRSNNSSKVVYKNFSDLRGKYTAQFANLGHIIEYLETSYGAATAISVTVFLLASSIIIDAIVKARGIKEQIDEELAKTS